MLDSEGRSEGVSERKKRSKEYENLTFDTIMINNNAKLLIII